MRKTKFRINSIITCVLVCITLFSSCLLAGIYAKYTSVSEGTGSVGVVTFDITKEGTIFDSIEAKVTPGENQSATLKITNNSGVAIEYKLTVTNTTRNIPLKFKLKPIGEAPAVQSESYENGVSINTAVRQTPGNYTDEYILDIVWDESASESTDLQYIGMVDYITISVTATQDE